MKRTPETDKAAEKEDKPMTDREKLQEWYESPLFSIDEAKVLRDPKDPERE